MIVKTGDVVQYIDRGTDRIVYNAIATTIHDQNLIDLIGALEVKNLSPPWAHIVERKVTRGKSGGCFFQIGDRCEGDGEMNEQASEPTVTIIKQYGSHRWGFFVGFFSGIGLGIAFARWWWGF